MKAAGSLLSRDDENRVVATVPAPKGGRLEQLLAGRLVADADINLRLARCFGMSEGFFLGLQQDYDVEELKRDHGAELDRIIPRAA